MLLQPFVTMLMMITDGQVKSQAQKNVDKAYLRPPFFLLHLSQIHVCVAPGPGSILQISWTLILLCPSWSMWPWSGFRLWELELSK